MCTLLFARFGAQSVDGTCAPSVRMEVMRGWPPTLWRFDEGGFRVSEVDAVGTYGFV